MGLSPLLHILFVSLTVDLAAAVWDASPPDLPRRRSSFIIKPAQL